MTETILFQTGFEAGNFNEFDIVSESGYPGATSKSVQTQFVHSGTRAAKLTISTSALWTALGAADSGIRLGFHNHGRVDPADPNNLPIRAMYEAWYFLPAVPVVDWLNIFQWKQAQATSYTEQTRVPVASLSATTIGNQLYLQLKHFIDDTGAYFNYPGATLATDTVPLPIGRWFPLTALYEWNREPIGRITVTSEGRTLFDFSGIRTEANLTYVSEPRQVTWNNYGNPKKYTLYIDDCKVWTE